MLIRTSHFLVGRVQSTLASPASEVVPGRTGRTRQARRAPIIVAAGVGIHPPQVARLVAVSCASALLLLMPVHAASPPGLEVGQATTAPVEGLKELSLQGLSIEDFLDRLMAAESAGRLQTKNPRSTALGPFQFIESTFLFVVNKHFQPEVAGLTKKQILARRTDMAFSRRVARAYVRDLISALATKDLPASPVNVRIAFLVGPSAAIRLLGTAPDEPLTTVLSPDAIAANPFMSGATVAQLVQRAAFDVSATSPAVRPAAATLVALEPEPSSTPIDSTTQPAGIPMEVQDEPIATTSPEPAPGVRCQIGLASCRRWIALQRRKAGQSMLSAEP